MRYKNTPKMFKYVYAEGYKWGKKNRKMYAIYKTGLYSRSLLVLTWTKILPFHLAFSRQWHVNACYCLSVCSKSDSSRTLSPLDD